MKYFAIVLMLLVLSPVKSLASGKLSVEPGYSLSSEKVGGQVGLSIYEPFIFGFKYNQWTGAGLSPHENDEDVTWAASKHALEYWFGHFGFGGGYKFQFNDAEADLASGPEHSVFVKLQYQLW